MSSSDWNRGGKPWRAWLALALWFAVGNARGASDDAGEGIWHVRLRTTSAGVEWLGAVRTGGHLKDRLDRRGDLEVELVREDGTTVHRTTVRDPRMQRWEYESAPGAGSLRWIQTQEESGEVELRLPARDGGRRVAVYRRAAGAGGAALLSPEGGRERLGEFELPDASGGEGGGRALGLATLPIPGLQLFTLLTNGPSAQRFNMVFLAEGYQTNEVPAFTNLAKTVLRHFLDGEPFRAYRGHINARAVFVPSKQSGSDHPSRNVTRDTYFQSAYDTSGIAYLVTLRGDGVSLAHAAVRSVEPAYDIIILLVNDPEYGGSGGGILVTSAHADSPRIAIHEMGHSLGLLADEYETPYPGYPILDEPNTTQETERNRIKWRSWILNATPVPTPPEARYAQTVGLFEGARYQSKGWYRPKQNCLMRTLGLPFCEVCREAMMLRFYQLVRPVDAVAPATNDVVLASATGSTRLSVTSVVPTEGTLVYEWRINDGPVLAGGGPALDLPAGTLPAGTNRVSVRVVDPTPWVRSDPQGRMAQTVEWRVAAPLSAAPSLQVALEPGGNLVLSWDLAAGDMAIEMRESWSAGDWTELLVPALEEGKRRLVRLPYPGDVAFFRLRRR